MTKKTQSLPVEVIREALEFDPLSPSGVRWKTRPLSHFSSVRGWKIFNSRFAGTCAGAKNTNHKPIKNRSVKRYWALTVAGRNCFAHRIVWILVYGEDPVDFHLDHRDGNGLNNLPDNLRIATRQQNSRNRDMQGNNKSGFKGVMWCGRRKKWRAKIGIGRQQRELGYFPDVQDAAAAYKAAAERIFGDFLHQK